MIALAVFLTAVGACGYAVGARLQHGAVHETIGDRGLRLRDQLRLVRNPRWLAGLVSLGTGVVLHVCALGLAPLSVVQPVGVLALPITVLLTVRERSHQFRDVQGSIVAAVFAATAGVGAFVLLAAGSAKGTPVTDSDERIATQLIVVAVLVVALIGLATRSKLRCITFAAGCAIAHGYVSLLIRGIAQDFGPLGLGAIDLFPLVGIVGAALVGAWLLQHAYASGPPDLVVACLTVIDPLVAVGLGIGLLGEADHAGATTAVLQVACAIVACTGVFALAKFHPDTQRPDDAHGAPDGGHTGGHTALAGPNRTDRSHRSTT